jgi:hypothetical protein
VLRRNNFSKKGAHVKIILLASIILPFNFGYSINLCKSLLTNNKLSDNVRLNKDNTSILTPYILTVKGKKYLNLMENLSEVFLKKETKTLEHIDSSLSTGTIPDFRKSIQESTIAVRTLGEVLELLRISISKNESPDEYVKNQYPNRRLSNLYSESLNRLIVILGSHRKKINEDVTALLGTRPKLTSIEALLEKEIDYIAETRNREHHNHLPQSTLEFWRHIDEVTIPYILAYFRALRLSFRLSRFQNYTMPDKFTINEIDSLFNLNFDHIAPKGVYDRRIKIYMQLAEESRRLSIKRTNENIGRIDRDWYHIYGDN